MAPSVPAAPAALTSDQETAFTDGVAAGTAAAAEAFRLAAVAADAHADADADAGEHAPDASQRPPHAGSPPAALTFADRETAFADGADAAAAAFRIAAAAVSTNSGEHDPDASLLPAAAAAGAQAAAALARAHQHAENAFAEGAAAAAATFENAAAGAAFAAESRASLKSVVETHAEGAGADAAAENTAAAAAFAAAAFAAAAAGDGTSAAEAFAAAHAAQGAKLVSQASPGTATQAPVVCDATTELDILLDKVVGTLGFLAQQLTQRHAFGAPHARVADERHACIVGGCACAHRLLSTLSLLLAEAEDTDVALAMDRMLALLMQAHGMLLRLHDPDANEPERLPRLFQAVLDLFNRHYPYHYLWGLCGLSADSVLKGGARPAFGSTTNMLERAAEKLNAWVYGMEWFDTDAFESDAPRAETLTAETLEAKATDCLRAVLADPFDCTHGEDGPESAAERPRKQRRMRADLAQRVALVNPFSGKRADEDTARGAERPRKQGRLRVEVFNLAELDRARNA
jgi:hypothetical protein